MSIYNKLFEAKKEIGKISKDSTNPFFKSKYFDINTLLEHVEPILAKHNLLLLQPIEDNKVYSKIVDIDDLKTGVLSSLELPNITDPQKLGSAITYYRRYTLQSLLGLQAEDDDANTASKATKKDDGKKWLNDNSKEWHNVMLAVENGKITNIDQVSKVYKISKEVRAKLELLIK